MPLILILAVPWLLLRMLGSLGVEPLRGWRTSGRLALAFLFGLAGVMHFTAYREDYRVMIPPPFPRELWLVYLSGLFELAGAVGLLVARFRRAAALGLMLLLVAVFPANVYAARENLRFSGQPHPDLALRAAIQLLYFGAVWWCGWRRPAAPALAGAAGTDKVAPTDPAPSEDARA
ncbi:MAG: DoxX family membrane protein [Planctomycetota bacterium]|nr:DoxX family membrane protein [Planctomycetota bacterium]